VNDKTLRQAAVQRHLAAHTAGSQAELVELLAREGFDTTQTTVSRDLEELGAVKLRDRLGRMVYALSTDQPYASVDDVGRALRQFALRMTPSANLLVLHTPPGHAHMVASTLDRAGLREVVGTITDDDTIAVIAREDVGGRALLAVLEELMGDPAAAGRRHGSDADDR